MGKSAGESPTPVDPKVVIPLQAQANKDQFDYALKGQRYNQYSPTGSQVWSQTPGAFREADYNAALEAWNKANSAIQTSAQPAPTPVADLANGGNYSGGAAWESGGSSGPSVGDTTQTSANVAAALANVGQMPTRDQFTDQGTWSLTNNLSENQQKLFDAGESSQIKQSQLLDALSGRLGSTLDSPISYEDIPALSSGQYNQDAADALYRQNTRYLDVQNKDQLSAMEARLAEQGFVPGTPGYQKAMTGFQDTSARAYADARDRATSQGTAYGQQQQTLDNSTRSQAIAELLQKRLQPLNELNALRSGVQATLPQGTPQGGGGGMQGTDIMGAYNNQYAGQANSYNAAVGSDNANTAAMSQLAMAAAMFFSDARLKDDIRLIGKTPGGSNLYAYTIFGRPETGVLAQELLRTNPSAVSLHESGFYVVDYSKVA